VIVGFMVIGVAWAGLTVAWLDAALRRARRRADAAPTAAAPGTVAA
jgi:hypothetical protein